MGLMTEILLLCTATMVSVLSLTIFPIAVAVMVLLYAVIWAWLGLEDARFLSVKAWLLALGVVSGISFISSYWIFFDQQSSIISSVVQSLFVACCIAIIGVILEKISDKPALGSADPFATFTLTLPLSYDGILWLLIFMFPLGYVIQHGRADRSIPLITVLVICSNGLVIWELLGSDSL